MQLEMIEEEYETLTDWGKQLLLSHLAYYLTLSTRKKYIRARLGHQSAVNELMTLNEMVNRITGAHVWLLVPEKRRHPDSLFWQMLIEGAEKTGLHRELQLALTRAWDVADGT